MAGKRATDVRGEQDRRVPGGPGRDRARGQGSDIADAWNDRYFFASYTRKPLEKCLLDSPAASGTADQLMASLVRAFEVFVHDVPEWEPKR